MNLLNLILTIGLMAVLAAIGVSYGGSSYSDSKVKAQYAQIQSDFNEMGAALKMAKSSGSDAFSFSGNDIWTKLLKEGYLSDIPSFDKNSGGGFSGVDYQFVRPFSISRSSIVKLELLMKGNEALCRYINKQNGMSGVIYNVAGNASQDEAVYPLPPSNAFSGAFTLHLAGQGKSLSDFAMDPLSVKRTVCYKFTLNTSSYYLVTHIPDYAEVISDYDVLMAGAGSS